MKYLGKILITLNVFVFLLILSSSAILAQDSIVVETKECYWVDPWWVGSDTVNSVSTPTFKTRYNPILKVWVFNNQGKVDYVSSMRVHFEGTDLADVEEVQIYRESRGDTNFVFYPTSSKDTLFCGSGSFDLSGDVFIDFVDDYPTDSTRFELPTGDSALYYVVFVIPSGLSQTHTDNLLDAMIPLNGVRTQNGEQAPAANAGEGRTYRVLLDATPPNLTEGDLYINIWGDSAVVKMGEIYHPDTAVWFTDSVVSLTDNVTDAIAQSLDDILVFADLQSLRKGYSSKRMTETATPGDFYFSDSIEHEDKDGYGVDIEADERLAGGGTPGSYIQKVTAWDEFGNSVVAWDLEDPKPIDTIWPDTNEVQWFLKYDANSDGIAGLGDTIEARVDMRNQPPASEPDELLNKDVYHDSSLVNGVYFWNRYDFRGFDPSGTNYTGYPLNFSDTPADEIWKFIFVVKAGDWDVDSGAATGYVFVTGEDNADYRENDHIGPGNQRRWKSSLFPFGVDNFPPVITGFTYDFATGGDITCFNVVNIGDILLFVADLRANLDTLSSVTIDLFTNGLGGPADAPLYDDGTHGDVTAADGYYSLEWTIPQPAPTQTWDGASHFCSLTVVDNAGNTIQAGATIVANKVVDTKKPYPVYADSGEALSGGRIHLWWRDSTAAGDKGYYYIYWNGGSGGIAGIDTTTQYGHVAAPESSWTSDPLTHGLNYCFLIRNVDDACNMEHNYYNITCITADAEAPTAEFVTPEDGDIHGPVSPNDTIQVIVRSPDADIDSFKVYYREKDIDPVTPGDQPGTWGLPGVVINNDGQYGTGRWDPTSSLNDGIWEGVVCGKDQAGNEQTPSQAYAAGQTVWIVWDSTPPTVFIHSINSDYNPAGVILENGVNNICVIGLDEDWTDSMDVWMRLQDGTKTDTLFQGLQAAGGISPTSPYCFDFSLAGWQADNAILTLWVFDRAGNKGMATVTRPVKDIYPVVARMTKPVNFERVMWTSAYPVQAEFLAGSPVSEVVMVQFQEKLRTDTTWTTFCTQYTPAGSLFNCIWDNTAYQHDNQVDLRALFFDNAIPSNVETTAFVTVTIDKEGPVIALEIKNAQLIGAVKYVAGDSLFLAARVLDTVTVDIKSVKFYKKKVSQPELYYEFMGNGVAANNFTIFQLRTQISSWDTTYWHIKAVPFDASGNEGASVVDSFYYKKTKAPQVAIYKVKTDHMDWINPSGHLRSDGTGMDVFAQAYKPITAWHRITTPADSGLVDNVGYSWAGWNLGNYGLNDSMSFNPLDEGIIHQSDLEGSGWYRSKLRANLTDIFSNMTTDTTFYLYILDVVGNQVVIIEPANNAYVSDVVTLKAGALHAYALRSVTYYYVQDGDTTEIGTSTDQANNWQFAWYTRNNVADGWYELTARSKDLADNLSDFGPSIRVFVCNTPPYAWMSLPEDSSFVGPNWDVVVEAFAKPKNVGGAGIDSVAFKYKGHTSGGSWTWIGADLLTTHGDSLFSVVWETSSVTEGWQHLSAWAYDSARNVGYADTINVYADATDPTVEIIAVNDDHNPFGMDLWGEPWVDTLKARAFDPGAYPSGLALLEFVVLDGSGNRVFFGEYQNPVPQAQYDKYWDNSGLDTGSYYFFVRAKDNVGNSALSDSVLLRIEDHSARIATVRAFHQNGYIYASVNKRGALNVTFQYLSLASSEWTDLGWADSTSSDLLWMTEWDPSTLAEGDYLARCVTRNQWDEDQIGPVVRFHVDADGVVEPAQTTAIGAISFRAVLEAGRQGVIKVAATSTPYLLAVYSDLYGIVQGQSRMSISKETDTDTYNGTFTIPTAISQGGTARFYASVAPDTAWIEMGGFDISEVDQYLGTNGPVTFVDGSAKIDIPGGAISVGTLNLVGYPTMMPEVVANECKKFTPVGNTDGLIWKWYLFSTSDTNLSDYAKITLYYDETQVTVPEAQLQVARWEGASGSPTAYCWDFADIESPTVDGVNNSITFWTKTLGTFTVIQTEVPMWATVEVDPNCSDYTNAMPCLISYIHSDYADIDQYSIKLKLGPVGETMTTIYYDNNFADGYCNPFNWKYSSSTGKWYCDSGGGWNSISGELDVCVKDEIKALAAGVYVVMVEAYDEVGNFASAVDTFTVDAAAPTVYIPGAYVAKDPEFYFVAKDTESGLDLSTIFVDLYAVTKQVGVADTSNFVEIQAFLGTYNSDQIEMANDTLFWLRAPMMGKFDLANSQAMDVVIHDGWCNDYRGDRPESYEEGICIPPSGHGPADCVGNSANHAYQRFVIDDEGPAIAPISGLDARPIVIKVEDAVSAVDWTTFKLFEDGTELSEGDRLVIDQANAIVKYTPTAVGLPFAVTVEDILANKAQETFTTEAKELTITNAHNYPNPFDKSTAITFDLSRAADVVMKIYDFAGELVKTVVPGDYYSAGAVTEYWYGKNDEGEELANGVYLCHIKANDGSHTATEVIKIAVVRKD